ncbi:MAG: SOS response-associated peptidase [Anaerolineales bacterium]|jgi:putative SOS response-associated peptidase YedK
MCGRFSLAADLDRIEQALQVHLPGLSLSPRFNIAPTQQVAALTSLDPLRLEMLRWGLVPSWARDPRVGARLINARAETASNKPAFRSALAKRRCLILADGFYEWEQVGIKGRPARKPYHVRLSSGDPFVFAGLWESWQDPQGKELRSCTILTCQANELIARFHQRMPVILGPQAARSWMEPSQVAGDLVQLLVPFASDRMTIKAVGPIVNNPRNDVPACLEPIG